MGHSGGEGGDGGGGSEVVSTALELCVVLWLKGWQTLEAIRILVEMTCILYYWNTISYVYIGDAKMRT